MRILIKDVIYEELKKGQVVCVLQEHHDTPWEIGLVVSVGSKDLSNKESIEAKVVRVESCTDKIEFCNIWLKI